MFKVPSFKAKKALLGFGLVFFLCDALASSCEDLFKNLENNPELATLIHNPSELKKKLDKIVRDTVTMSFSTSSAELVLRLKKYNSFWGPDMSGQNFVDLLIANQWRLEHPELSQLSLQEIKSKPGFSEFEIIDKYYSKLERELLARYRFLTNPAIPSKIAPLSGSSKNCFKFPSSS